MISQELIRSILGRYTLPWEGTHGVPHWARMNIAPLQRAGLLTADVLAGKDVDKAIADRASWRDDERRWCREGKLPKPGWWE